MEVISNQFKVQKDKLEEKVKENIGKMKNGIELMKLMKEKNIEVPQDVQEKLKEMDIKQVLKFLEENKRVLLMITSKLF